MSIKDQIKNSLLPLSISLATACMLLYVGDAFATASGGGGGGGGDATGLGEIAQNVTGSFKYIGQLMIGTAYLAGIGFGIAAIFKFKQHKDNPTQIPVGTPIALLVISITLVFLPLLFKPAGQTLFKEQSDKFSEADAFSGGGAEFLPGGK